MLIWLKGKIANHSQVISLLINTTMGISNVIQESYCVWSWFLPLATGAIGALIGTYGGACFLQRKQEHKVKNVRLIAIKALNIFRDYSIQKNITLTQQMSLT